MIRRSLPLFICLLSLFTFTTLVGCGGSETQVIQPTENYEPTDEEKANQASQDEAMERGDTPE